jgi:hypothetical protein
MPRLPATNPLDTVAGRRAAEWRLRAAWVGLDWDEPHSSSDRKGAPHVRLPVMVAELETADFADQQGCLLSVSMFAIGGAHKRRAPLASRFS